jgi:hypothetical protein
MGDSPERWPLSSVPTRLPGGFVTRHVSVDWVGVPQEDKAEDEVSLLNG